MTRFPRLFLISLFVVCSAFADEPVELRSIYARNHDVEQLLKRDNAETSVFLFARVNCPAVDLAVKPLLELNKKLEGKKVAFYMIYSYAGLNIREIALHAQELGIPFRAFLDIDQNLSKKWKVKRTATAVVVNRKGDILYHGAILDGDRSGGIRDFHLENALNEHLAGQEIKVKSTPAQGCIINTRKPQLPKGLTFNKDILPIVQEKCQRCHRPGEVAPMSLLTYEDVVDNSPMIAQVVEDRTMPPWPAETKHKLKNNAKLSDEQVSKILGWIAEDMPEGKPEDAPQAKVWPDGSTWRIGQPDLIFKSREYKVPAQGIVPYIYTRHAIDADQDLYLEALEVKPGARRVVHHMAIHEFPYSDKPITAVDLVKIYGLEISNTILGAYVPGIEPRILPPGHGIKIKKGMGVLMDAHYTPTGKEATDITQLGLKVTTTPPEREVFSRWFYRSRGRFGVPKQADHKEMVRDDIFFDKDVEILEIRPHLHARGKNFLVEKVKYDGARPGEEAADTLIAVPRWDFNWQYDYAFETPVKVTGGEAIRIRAAWDNTEFNPTNPDPNVDVQFGEQTQDEMMGVLVMWRNAK